MVMLGCRPEGRFTEQHDIFFGIGETLQDLIPGMKLFWKEAKGNIHIDAWREVTLVDNYTITIVPKNSVTTNTKKLFFINLGGYKENEFEEYHYKILAVADSLAEATKKSKETIFYKHCGFKGATSHIDDKFGIDVDEIYNIKEILAPSFKEKYEILISKNRVDSEDDKLHIGYLKLDKLKALIQTDGTK